MNDATIAWNPKHHSTAHSKCERPISFDQISAQHGKS